MAIVRLRAAVFSRESKGKGASIDDQERENLAACEELDAEVAVSLNDKVGASRFTSKRRVGWPEIIELVRSGRIDLLVVWEVSRADRKMDTWVPFVSACGERGVRLHITSLEMTYDPRKAAHRKALLDMGSSAEHETGQLSERSKKGVVGAALEGKAHGPSAYGYTRVYGPIIEGKRTFTEVPNEHAPTVIMIITRVARRDSLTAIMRDLAEAGIASPRGGVWTGKTIKRIVRCRTYLGQRRHKDKIYEGNWPPISDASDWERTFWEAQAVLDEPDRGATRPGQTKHLLAYIVASGGCVMGGRLCRQDRADGGGESRYKCAKDGCMSIGAAELEEYVLRLILSRLAQPDARRFFSRGGEELAAAKREVDRLERQIEEAHESFADPDGGISAEALAKKERRIKPLLDEARRRVKAARRVDAVLNIFGDDEYREAAARERWAEAGLLAKRAVIKSMFESIELWPVPYVLVRRKLTRHASFDERLALVADRVTVRWSIHS